MPWKMRCKQCRQFRCTCERATRTESKATANDTPSDDSSEVTPGRRQLLQSLAGLHSTSRSNSRVPIRLARDRQRERQQKDREDLSSSYIAPQNARSASAASSLSKSTVEGGRPGLPTSKSAKADLNRHHSDAFPEPKPRRNHSSNLLTYDARKPTNRYNANVKQSPEKTGTKSIEDSIYYAKEVKHNPAGRKKSIIVEL